MSAGVWLSDHTPDTQPESLSLTALLTEAQTALTDFWEDTAHRLTTLLQDSFPEEDWSGATLAAWDWSFASGDCLAAVDRGKQRTTYYVNQTVKQAFRSAELIPFRAEEIAFAQDSAEDDAVIADGSFRCDFTLDALTYSLYFHLSERQCSWDSLSCTTADYEQGWSARFVGTRMRWSRYEGVVSTIDREVAVEAGFADFAGADPPRIMTILWDAYAAYQAGEPPCIPDSADDYRIPQPMETPLKKGTYDVYSGPGKTYYWEAEGRACVSTADWVQVFGRERDWALIQYCVDGMKLRFGYIHRDAFKAWKSVPKLSFEHTALTQDNEFVTSDPLGACERLDLPEGQKKLTRLASMGDTWMYVELTLPGGQKARMFAEITPGHG